jgi:hypothetical protein
MSSTHEKLPFPFPLKPISIYSTLKLWRTFFRELNIHARAIRQNRET